MQTKTSTKLLEVNNVTKWFPILRGSLMGISGYVKAVDGVSFSINQGEAFGLVGESGCGKSTLAKTIIRLIEPTTGVIAFNEKNLAEAEGAELHKIRRDIQIVFQDPYGSLNPRMRIRKIIEEPLKAHKVGNRAERFELMQSMLASVGLPSNAINNYPHEFSGGQRQRIAVARALVLNPKLVILDEPTSALDVSVRSQVMNLLKKLQKEFALTYLLISHDLSLVEHMCDKVGVMYLGKIVEVAKSFDLYKDPAHPYTKALFSAIPKPTVQDSGQRIILEGDVPDPASPPDGCRFHTRCKEATELCKKIEPGMLKIGLDHMVQCHLYS